MKIISIAKTIAKPQCDLTTSTGNFYIKAGNTYILTHNSPACLVGHGIEGYPDSFIGIKSVLSDPKNAYSSMEEIEEKYPEADRAQFREMLGYCLELAPMIPEGEVWQGDCLFVQSSLEEETIDGVDCITFQPNKILYAVDKNSDTGKAIQKAKFGIAFHTKYVRSGDGWKQSFSMSDAADKLRANGAGDDFFFMGVQLHATKDQSSKAVEEARSKAPVLADQLEAEAKKLREDPMYEEMCSNDDFIKVSFRTFENANTSDKKSATINEETFFDDIESYLRDKMGKAFDKKYASLKTEKGKEKAKANYDKSLVDLKDYIDNHKDTLKQIVKTLNIAAQLKMVFWDVLKDFTNSDAKTYLRSRTRGIVPAGNEGIAVSDDDGNIVKIVDKTTFSAANRDPDYMSGFEHTNNKDKPKTERVVHGRLGNILRMHDTQRKRWSILAESHHIKEAQLKFDTVAHVNEYLDMLISKIQNDEDITLFESDEKLKISDLSQENKDKLLDICNEFKNDVANVNSTVSLWEKFNNDFKAITGKKVSDIDKSPFSGQGKGSAKLSAEADGEPIQGVMLALNILGLQDAVTNSDITNSKSQIYTGEIDDPKLAKLKECDIHLADSVLSKSFDNNTVKNQLSKVLYMDLNGSDFDKFKDGHFTILHPTGITNGQLESKVKPIRDMLFLNKIKVVNDSGITLEPNIFAPADLYLIDTSRLDVIYNQLSNFVKSEKHYAKQFVSIVNGLFNDEHIVLPISLKQSSNPSLHKIINSNTKILDSYSISSITEIDFSSTGNTYVHFTNGKGKQLLFEFRRKGSSATSWQCTATEKDNTEAYTGGGAKTYMKLAFEDDLKEVITSQEFSDIVNSQLLAGKIKGVDEKVEQYATSIVKKDASAQVFSNAGLAIFLKKLLDSKDKANNRLSCIVNSSFKLSDIVQDTLKIM